MMSHKRSVASLMMVSASLAVLAGCNPPNNIQPPQPTPTPVATSSPTASPSAQPSGGPSTDPSPSANPSGSPSASPSGNPSSSPSASSTPTPQPSDVSVIERTTFNGKVFDDTTAPIDGVIVTAKSLNSSVAYEATSTTAGGAYAFNNAPAGVQIEIKVSKPGFTTRRRVEVLKSNKQGNPDANKYDFGAGASSNGNAGNALSDKPEVIAVTPGRNAAGVSSTSSFVLKFSEAMDRNTVTDNFEVRAFSTEKLSVDTSGNASTVVGAPGDINTLGVTRIWDKSAFNVSWNSDDTEATFTFKEERALPSDKDTDKVPDYQVSLERLDGNIKDKSGISRSTSATITGGGQGAFKLTEGNFERSFKFSIAADTTKPRVDSITAQTAENSGSNSDGDVIRVRFSERMIHYTLGPTIAGGMGGTASQAAAGTAGTNAQLAAANYMVTVTPSGSQVPNATQTWTALAGAGARAVFDTNDPTHKTVLLLPATSATNVYAPGDNINVMVATTVVDPAGNTIDSAGDDASANAS